MKQLLKFLLRFIWRKYFIWWGYLLSLGDVSFGACTNWFWGNKGQHCCGGKHAARWDGPIQGGRYQAGQAPSRCIEPGWGRILYCKAGLDNGITQHQVRPALCNSLVDKMLSREVCLCTRPALYTTIEQTPISIYRSARTCLAFLRVAGISAIPAWWEIRS